MSAKCLRRDDDELVAARREHLVNQLAAERVDDAPIADSLHRDVARAGDGAAGKDVVGAAIDEDGALLLEEVPRLAIRTSCKWSD